MIKKRILTIFCSFLCLVGCTSQPLESEENQTADTSEIQLETGVYEDGEHPSISGEKISLIINGTEEVIVNLYDTEAAQVLLERLPLNDLSFYDLQHVEKPVENLEPLEVSETRGYDPIAGEVMIYKPWGNITFFYEDFGYTDGLVPIGIVESGLEYISEKEDGFVGSLELVD